MLTQRPRFSSPRPDDKVLVRRMRAGEESAFEEFFEANFHGLYRFVLIRLDRNSELAKEVVQAAMCTAVEKLDTYRGEAPLFSWLCTICRFEITAFFRRERRQPPKVELNEEVLEVSGVLESITVDLDSPERRLLRQEVARLVHVTVDKLPTNWGQVLEWKYADGLSVKEIAARLGVSPKAAESSLSRARRAFRDGFASISNSLGNVAASGELP